jgi:large subunit ribosomal protein L13
MKTFSQKPAEVEKKWVLIDAKISSSAVSHPSSPPACAASTSHLHPARRCGDNVIVINADKVVLTGKKHRQEVLLAHRLSRRHQGAHAPSPARRPFPERVVEKAVERMLPRGPLGRRQMKNLRVYAGAEHPHEAQQPKCSTSPR